MNWENSFGFHLFDLNVLPNPRTWAQIVSWLIWVNYQVIINQLSSERPSIKSPLIRFNCHIHHFYVAHPTLNRFCQTNHLFASLQIVHHSSSINGFEAIRNRHVLFASILLSSELFKTFSSFICFVSTSFIPHFNSNLIYPIYFWILIFLSIFIFKLPSHLTLNLLLLRTSIYPDDFFYVNHLCKCDLSDSYLLVWITYLHCVSWLSIWIIT